MKAKDKILQLQSHLVRIDIAIQTLHNKIEMINNDQFIIFPSISIKIIEDILNDFENLKADIQEEIEVQEQLRGNQP